ncbi:serine/threonine-protein kinase BLUS1-like isoform X2 [Amaranthus tricolor]|uniref:serine/threonine-protein kinase BLUS1-like isoform X2 n=1 Tax=Amaranthus tricolor TaxID=29722 RepID=UPI00258C0B6C|nr:serine/threonine-protein kinase BLUS1-like isoform X2 [Amaranthus tricolor]
MGRSGNGQRSYSVNANDYKLLEEVGFGASATVFRAIYVPYSEVVAIKCLDLDRCNSNLDDIRREAQMMSLIDHPNVVRAYCSFVVERHLWVVMPFMAEGSCLHLMKIAYPDGFEEPAICSILKETLKALEYLHRHGHIHRDVKAGNILLDTNGLVKLADFGVSACMFDSGDRQRSRNTFVGTPCWMAPEVLQPGSGYNFKADIWSFGITALELAHGHAPFSKYPPMKVLLMTIQNAPPGLDYDRDKKFSKSFKEMVAMCLVKDQAKRPTAEKLLKHSFFKHAKPPELSVKKLFADLPPLWDRVKALECKDAAQLALKRMPSAEQEAISQNEYKRGVSAWNFDVEDLKAQAALVQDDDGFTDIKEADESVKSAHSSKDASDAGSVSGRNIPLNDIVHREQVNSDAAAVLPTEGTISRFRTGIELSDSFSHGKSILDKDGLDVESAAPSFETETAQVKANSQAVRGRQSQSGPLTPGIVLGQTSMERGRVSERPENENQSTAEKSNRGTRRAPSFSGPLMLPTRASANSLSAPIKSSGGYKDSLDEKSKANLVQIKGRFSVTSESLDVVKGSPLRKSASVGDWISESKQTITNQANRETGSGNVSASLLLPHLQNLFQQTAIQQDLIMSLLNSFQSSEVDGCQNGKLPAIPLPGGLENGNVEAVASEREQLLLDKISDLQTRMANLSEELNTEKQKYLLLQQQINTVSRRQEDDEE